MTPIKTDRTNLMLGAPQGWDAVINGPCIGLPVVATEDPYFYSYWRLSWREWFAVLLGRPVRLCVASGAHPPVMLDTKE